MNYRIVRNKAAEKAKHVHHQSQQQPSSNNNNQSGQQSQQQQQQQQVQNNNSGGGGGVTPTGNTTINVSVITHAPPIHSQQQQQQTQLGSGNNGLNGTPERTTGYSINGILGIQHTGTDPNGNSIKRKRIDDHHGEYFPFIHIVHIQKMHYSR